ncbi:MAG: PDZ domain-containing protein [Verrucomicrobia bacterium]|nr:PDZ domain-containing protein [Verrucomicrobiota bacterium]
MRTLLLLSLTSLLLSSAASLKKGDVKETFDEMLQMHVQQEQMNPMLIKRASKIFIEQFDSAKIYLLESEVHRLAFPDKKKLEMGVARYQNDDLSNFNEINKIVCQAIKRARQWRHEFQKEYILSAHDLQPIKDETFLSYAETEGQLKNRIQNQLIRILVEERKMNQLDDWSPQDREKIFNLWERRFQAKEDLYLSKGANEEHYLTLHTLYALAKSLDAHTAYFSPEEATEMRTSLEKQFEGIGVVLREGINGVIIENMVKGGPAEKSQKIQVGDQIVQIDRKKISDMSYAQVLKALKGDGGKDIELALKRNGDSRTHFVTLQREKIALDDDRLQCHSTPCGNGHIGILTLPSFYEGGHLTSADRDMREAIKKLKREAPLKGLILDLRENSGGFLTQAVKIASLFVSRGVIVISKYSRGEVKYYRNLDGQLYFDGPLIVLTSRASASAAEIVAQALQDYGVALIVGDQETFGKGTIQYQTVTDSDAKSYYKVTVGRYYTVSGRSAQIDGVKADIVVPTIFSSYKIGERFLEYPLPSDQIASVYIDPLTDVDMRSRSWFQKHYLPNLHQPEDKWKKILPLLKENSRYRLASDKSFVHFLKEQEKKAASSSFRFKREEKSTWGDGDLQLLEAINIVRDMIELQNNS